jgi:hypothetical protein
MPPSPACDDGRLPSAAEANEAVRRYSAGRTSWTDAELRELARLRAVWLRAWRAELVRAA